MAEVVAPGLLSERPQFRLLDIKRQSWQWIRCYGSGGVLLCLIPA